MENNNQTKEFLENEYSVGKKTMNQIASECGCSWDVVYKRLRNYNIPIRETNRNARGDGSKRTTTDIRSFQKKVLKKYGYKCAICGYNKFVNAHHIQSWAIYRDNSIKNGVALCPNHHAEADNGILDEAELRKYQIKD